MPTANPCHVGALACSTGTPTCTDKGTNVSAGTTCGTNMVCSSTGSCIACTAGTACIPTTNKCHAGFQACSPSITCADSGSALVNGTVCGTNMVCSNGTCVPCTPGTSCQPSNPCRTGATSCVTGASVCAETGNQPNGTSCGMNKVCNAGACVICTPGGACNPPANPCHNGTLTCMTGTQTCADSGTNVTDGTSCGMDLVCKGGVCVSCVAGQTCTPSDPCKNGSTSCSTGSSVCVTTTNKPVGTLCGSAQTCSGGVKTSAAMCTASAACATTMTTCPSACNTAGTDCNACLAGQTMCTNGCQTLASDPANCGTCGKVCPDPPVIGSGSAVCNSGTCGLSCNAGYLACGGTSYCQIASWTFEDGMTDGFGIVGNNQMAVTSISASTSVAHSGTYALAIGVTAMGMTNRGFDVGLKMCGGSGFLPSGGRTVSAWFYLQPNDASVPPPSPTSRFGLHLYTNSSDAASTPNNATVGTWFQVTAPLDNAGNQLIALALEGFFDTDGTSATDWSGVVYVDDITIQ